MIVIAGVIAFANGFVVGSALVAFLTILRIVPRLAEVTHTHNCLRYYAAAIVLGALAATVAYFNRFTLYCPEMITMLPGLFMGLFVGTLAAALAEVLDVLPVLARRVRLKVYIKYLLVFIILGKVVGSLVYWLATGLW